VNKKVFFITVVLLLTLSLIAIGCSSTPEEKPPTTPAPAPSTPTPATPQAQTLRIGFITGLTGWASVGTVFQTHGATIAAEMLNEKGGLNVNGQKYNIELVIEDDKSTTDGSVAATNKLVYDENIKFIGGYPLWFAAASKDICEPEKVFRAIVWTCCTPGELGADTPYTFLCASATYEQAVAALDYLKDAHPDVKSLVCILPDDGTLENAWPTIMNMLEARGLSMAGDVILYPNDMVDFSPIAAKVVGRKADAILQVNGWAPHSGGILKGVRELGDERLYAAAVPATAAENLAICGAEAAQDFFCVAPMLGAPGNPPLMEEVGKRLKDQFGDDLNQLALNGFNCVWVIGQAIEAAQSLDTTAARDALQKMTAIDTAYGTGHLGGMKTYGIQHAVNMPCALQLLDNGEVKFGEWVNVSLP
jgi:branched-chain amino acid transport system substrate-binding protein